MEYYGYAGKILYVDLTSGQSRTEPLDIEMARKYIGGCGIGERLLFDVLKPGTDPLSPDNPIILSAGPLIGTIGPSTSKIQLLTKSATPANKEQSKYYVGWSSGGSHRFGIMMKSAGYDQIVITGRAKKPVYLKIIDDDVEICDAGDLWGKKDVYETSDELLKRYKGCGVIAIGKAGENQVVFALGFIDKRDNFARNGGATVMGNKNLKAIAVYGSKGVKVAEPKKFLKLADKIAFEIGGEPLGGRITPKKTKAAAAVEPPKVDWAALYPPDLPQQVRTELRACSCCPHACRSIYTIDKGEFAGTDLALGFFAHVPRYGRYMELKDYTHAMKLLDTCNRNGICYVTASAMIKFVTALYERGVIGKKETDGLELKMGDLNSYLKLLEKIINREGIGDAMARGWFALEERLGVDEDTYDNSRGVIKGSSVILGVEERTMPLLFGMIVNPRGSMHIHPVTYFENLPVEKTKEWFRNLGMSEEEIDRAFTNGDFDLGRLEKHTEEGECVYWALGVCVLGVMIGVQDLKKLAELYSYATGIQTSPEEFKKAGERIWNLLKLFNVREGFSREDDTVPALWLKSMKEPIKDYVMGQFQFKDYHGQPVTPELIKESLDNYYDEHGWDVNKGIPTRERLAELGLEEFAGMLPDA